MTHQQFYETVQREQESIHVFREKVMYLLDYNAGTGAFCWRVNVGRWGRIQAGSTAGNDSHGYRCIRIDKRPYPAHRLAWLIMRGDWPAGEIDHINGNRGDNRFVNLRDVPKVWNGHNRKGPNRDNRSTGLLGATRNGKANSWMAQITVNGKRIYLGSFRTPEQAHAAYVAAKREKHPGYVEINDGL